jgi:hypothetical protein
MGMKKRQDEYIGIEIEVFQQRENLRKPVRKHAAKSHICQSLRHLLPVTAHLIKNINTVESRN